MSLEWKTKDGRKIKIKDMGDTHLLNAVRFLRKNADKMHAKAISDSYNCLGMLQGEMAEMACESGIEQLEETNPQDFLEGLAEFREMLKEIKKRKLKELVWQPYDAFDL